MYGVQDSFWVARASTKQTFVQTTRTSSLSNIAGMQSFIVYEFLRDQEMDSFFGSLESFPKETVATLVSEGCVFAGLPSSLILGCFL